MPELRPEFCYYCHDAERLSSWTYLGGTIDETHYICHRTKCLENHAMYLLKYRMTRKEQLRKRS